MQHAHSEPIPTTQIAFRLPVEQYDQLKALAERNHRTVSQELRRGIDYLLMEPKRRAA